MVNIKFKIDNKGISLLESIVAISMFIMIIGGITALMKFGFFSRDVIWEQLKTQSEGRRVVQSFIDELRSANYSSLGAYPIEKATLNEFIFFSNIDNDNNVERIRYFLDGTNFNKGVVKFSENPPAYNTSTNETIITIARDVINGYEQGIFSYYDADYDGFSTSSPSLSYPINIAQIKVVRVRLLMEAKPNISPEPFLIETVSQIRNLKTN